MNQRQTIVWQGLVVDIPATWEMTRYGLRRDRGTCVFIDEWGERLQFAWQRGTSRPDAARVLGDIRARVTAASKAAAEAPPEIGDLPKAAGWDGLCVEKASGTTTHAFRLLDDGTTLVEVTLRHAAGDTDAPAEEPGILASIRSAAGSDACEWRAFGIRATLPAELPLASAAILPGDATLCFESEGRRAAASIRRMAFPGMRLTTTLQAWLSAQPPAGSQPPAVSPLSLPGRHDGLRLETASRQGRLARLTGGARHRRDIAAICPNEKRLYHLVVETNTKAWPACRVLCRCGHDFASP